MCSHCGMHAVFLLPIHLELMLANERYDRVRLNWLSYLSWVESTYSTLVGEDRVHACAYQHMSLAQFLKPGGLVQAYNVCVVLAPPRSLRISLP
mgnify:CR=1 FL=1